MSARVTAAIMANTSPRIQPPGYHKYSTLEPVVLEPEDWTVEEWATLCKVSGVPANRTERIVLNLSSIECYIGSGEQSGRK